ncbi:hypothetical protein H7J77_18085 [Mycolicibacillus parakoreensis]|uniref:Uncharacterized protein n=1 Tax=Mycolicibacillus parakoreensis TaxID=1069221 RepID=A0ABY3U934_9MYCO|nr:hypothetical protein [Mycolicibacillus parakoreensis]MCV7317446.1 hypothetical protein [Mycolicibacillus parakoreensis]ULN53935.1 hypothetical protein MIU77_06475 [Mycolicibacillus parakoreensis]
MARLDVHDGDFPKNTRLSFFGKSGTLVVPWQPGDGFKGDHERIALDDSTVSWLDIAAEQISKKGRHTAKSALIGALVGDVVGLMAGAVIGWRQKTVTFVLEFTDGRWLHATTSVKGFGKLVRAVGAGEL